jgi:TolB-like protein
MSVRGDGVKRLAVLEFELVQGVKIDRTYFSDLARGAVRKAAPQLSVMTRESTQAILEANGKTLADCTGECEVEVGRKLGADYIISGRITQIGTRLALTMRLFATADGSLLGDEEANGKNPDELVDEARLAIVRLTSQFSSNSTPMPTGNVQVSHAERKTASTSEPEPQVADGQLEATVDVVVRSVNGEPLAGAVIAVDGATAGIAPMALSIRPGKHVIAVAKDLYLPASTAMVLGPNDLQKATFELKPDFALASIDSDPPNANISIDGISVGATPSEQDPDSLGQALLVGRAA